MVNDLTRVVVNDLAKDRMHWKRYAFVFGIGLVIANLYAFWPAIAYPTTAFDCQGIIGPIWYEVTGAALVVGPPLYSEMQLVMHPGSTAYETAIQQSDNNNLTKLYQNYTRSWSIPVIKYLFQIDGFTGLEYQNIVAASQAGVTMTFQNITFQGIHVARFVYRIDVSNSAKAASYELASLPCEAGLLLTVGNLPYAGPLAYGPVQLITFIISNLVALISSTIFCMILRFYWSRPTRTGKGTLLDSAPRPSHV